MIIPCKVSLLSYSSLPCHVMCVVCFLLCHERLNGKRKYEAHYSSQFRFFAEIIIEDNTKVSHYCYQVFHVMCRLFALCNESLNQENLASLFNLISRNSFPVSLVLTS